MQQRIAGQELNLQPLQEDCYLCKWATELPSSPQIPVYALLKLLRFETSCTIALHSHQWIKFFLTVVAHLVIWLLYFLVRYFRLVNTFVSSCWFKHRPMHMNSHQDIILKAAQKGVCLFPLKNCHEVVRGWLLRSEFKFKRSFHLSQLIFPSVTSFSQSGLTSWPSRITANTHANTPGNLWSKLWMRSRKMRLHWPCELVFHTLFSWLWFTCSHKCDHDNFLILFPPFHQGTLGLMRRFLRPLLVFLFSKVRTKKSQQSSLYLILSVLV